MKGEIRFRSLAAGATHACGLGLGGDERLVEIAAGAAHACALTAEEDVGCRGPDPSDPSGQASAGGVSNAPVLVELPPP